MSHGYQLWSITTPDSGKHEIKQVDGKYQVYLNGRYIGTAETFKDALEQATNGKNE